MKQDNQNQILQQKENVFHKTAASDLLVIPEVVRNNMQKASAVPRRKRHTNYIKKITNDPFIMNI